MPKRENNTHSSTGPIRHFGKRNIDLACGKRAQCTLDDRCCTFHLIAASNCLEYRLPEMVTATVSVSFCALRRESAAVLYVAMHISGVCGQTPVSQEVLDKYLLLHQRLFWPKGGGAWVNLPGGANLVFFPSFPFLHHPQNPTLKEKACTVGVRVYCTHCTHERVQNAGGERPTAREGLRHVQGRLRVILVILIQKLHVVIVG